MKRFLLIPLLALAACADAESASSTEATATSTDGTVLVGETLPAGEALTVDALATQASDLNGETVLVEGEIEKVCQQAGCWLTFIAADNQSIRVAVPRDDEDNYVFTFPKDVAGQTVRVAGTFAVEEESVEILRHYAEDEGASEEEIAAITEPRLTLALEASGAELAGPSDNA